MDNKHLTQEWLSRIANFKSTRQRYPHRIRRAILGIIRSNFYPRSELSVPGWLWYLFLLLLSIVLVTFVIWKTRNKLVFTFFLNMAGLCCFLDFSIFRLFRGYEYRPGLVQDKLVDGILGGLVTDFFLIPATAAVIAAFELGWGWIVVFSLLITGVEILFVKLGIYYQNWWKSYYTFIGLLLFNALGKSWFRRLNRSHGRALTFVTLLFILFVLRANFEVILIPILKTNQYHVKWLESLGIPSHSILTPFSMLTAVIFTSLIVFRARWFWKAIAVVGIFVLDLALVGLNVSIPRTNWYYIFAILEDVLVLLIGLRFARLLRENEVKKCSQ
jgi:hypothetical protein